MTLREFLFKDMTPCLDGNCIIGGKRKGLQTNGGCNCFKNLKPSQLGIIGSKLRSLADIEIDLKRNDK